MAKLEKLDLRPYSRNSDKFSTKVFIEEGSGSRDFVWIEAGASELTGPDSRGVSWFKIRGRGTDFEHDSTYLVSLPLVGITSDFIGSRHTTLYGTIAWNEGLRVIPAGFNPEAEAKPCEECEDRHLIGEFYCPKEDPALLKLPAGHRVRIDMLVLEPKG